MKLSQWTWQIHCWTWSTICLVHSVTSMSKEEKLKWREEVREMFYHAYNNYMENAYPADELMPLSCQGRNRDTKPSRGDMDEVLGDFSLTLVDSFDTLVVMGDIKGFEEAIHLINRDVHFDRDVVVSVFETNIRVLGGLLSGHVLAILLQNSGQGLEWYKGELLKKAVDLGNRILPAFNSTTGIPFPKVNLKYGVHPVTTAKTGHEQDTCTACAGTMLLEFAALSRLSGDPVFEAKARHAMDRLWHFRHRSSNLVGTVINIHNGEWVQRESGVGAGIDSYYEYLLKAYILLGEDTYLDRFNLHYESIMKFVNQGHILMNVQMHKPHTNSRNFMDSLQAFWPGLQVLKGDLKPAIEIHEVLYQVTQRHNFLPEGFTSDFRVHWGQHPLRPEFVESTYFLHRATNDSHYLDVGRQVIENLNRLARVPCGFAAIKDVRRWTKEDQMDSFVLSETFKYLYLLFSEEEDLPFNVHDFVFTTEAHFLPLSLALRDVAANISQSSKKTTEEQADETAETMRVWLDDVEEEDDQDESYWTCPNTLANSGNPHNFAHNVRSGVKSNYEPTCPQQKAQRTPRLKAAEFMTGNTEHMEHLRQMGIRVVPLADGRVQLLHTAAEAASADDAEDGMLFMQDMINLAKTQANLEQLKVLEEHPIVQVVSESPGGTSPVYHAGPAQFGPKLTKESSIMGEVIMADPETGCVPFHNANRVINRIVITRRGECMFIDKARHAEAAGALACIVIDNTPGSSSVTHPSFAMSSDGQDDVNIPMLFLFNKEGEALVQRMQNHKHLLVFMGPKPLTKDEIDRDIIIETGEPLDYRPLTDHLVVQLQNFADDPMDGPGIALSWGQDGLPSLRMQHNAKEEHIEVIFNLQILKSMMNTKVSSTVAKVVELVRGNSNFISLDLKKQSDYLFTLGKLIEEAVTQEKHEDLAVKLLSVLQQNLQVSYESMVKYVDFDPTAPPSDDKDDVQKAISLGLFSKLREAFAEHIDIRLKEVFDDIQEVIKALQPAVKNQEKKKNIQQKNKDNSEEAAAESKDMLEQMKDALNEKKNGRNRKKDVTNLNKQSEVYMVPVDKIKMPQGSSEKFFKPPAWMVLRDEEIFIDSYGRMYWNKGKEELTETEVEEMRIMWQELHGTEIGEEEGQRSHGSPAGRDVPPWKDQLFVGEVDSNRKEETSHEEEANTEADEQDELEENDDDQPSSVDERDKLFVGEDDEEEETELTVEELTEADVEAEGYDEEMLEEQGYEVSETNGGVTETDRSSSVEFVDVADKKEDVEDVLHEGPNQLFVGSEDEKAATNNDDISQSESALCNGQVDGDESKETVAYEQKLMEDANFDVNDDQLQDNQKETRSDHGDPPENIQRKTSSADIKLPASATHQISASENQEDKFQPRMDEQYGEGDQGRWEKTVKSETDDLQYLSSLLDDLGEEEANSDSVGSKHDFHTHNVNSQRHSKNTQDQEQTSQDQKQTSQDQERTSQKLASVTEVQEQKHEHDDL